MSTKAKPNEIKITRIYDAPVKAVWDAWTDLKAVAQWWGPRGFTITTRSKELKPGGHWDYTMHGPDGTNYPNLTKYHEVEKYSRLVYDHGGTREKPPLFRVTVNFKEHKGKTEMEMTMALATAEAAEEIKKFIKKAGGNATWDRLSEYLGKESSGKEKFVINRTFEAPRALVWEMWTNPKHFVHWLPPTYSQMEFFKADIRPGGKTFYVMTGENNSKMYARAEYLEVVNPERIVYTQQFCDENEKVSRHPFAPTWPETMLTIVTLMEEGPDQTRVTVEWEPYGNVSREELEAFVMARGGMTQGWTGSFDKLEEYLKGRSS